MAQARTSSEVAITGAKPVVMTQSFTWKFWVIVVMIVVVAITPLIPTLWGWQFGWIGTGHGGWSMAAHNGIMPGSIVYKKTLAEYSVGDKISFRYRGSADPTENGPSLKLIVTKNSDGTYLVEGMNKTNSIPPCNVKPEDIDGKVVWSQSFMPESYWRWLSLGWALNTDEINARWHAIFSLRTVGSVFTKQGRIRNWAEWRFSHKAIHWGPNNLWSAQCERNKFKVFSGTTRLVETEGVISGWEGGKLKYRISKPNGEYQVLEWSRKGKAVIEDVRLTGFKAMTQDGFRISGRSQSNLDPSDVVDGDLKTSWSFNLPGSLWQIDLGEVRNWMVRCWGGNTGIWPIKTGWEYSLDAVSWHPLPLSPNKFLLTYEGPLHPLSYSEGEEVKTRYLRFGPARGSKGGLVELEVMARPAE